jgi:hypothetical protein
VQEAEPGSDLIGNAGCPVAVGANRVYAQLRWEDQCSAIDLGDRHEVEMERGDDRVPAASTAERPEEVGVGLGIDPALLAVRGHELDRVHSI